MMIEGEEGAVLFHVIPDLLKAVHLAKLGSQLLRVATENANIEVWRASVCVATIDP